MSVEVMPSGIQCNLRCPYCYQHPQRDAGYFIQDVPYDLELMKKTLAKNAPRGFSVFGGEALLMPFKDLYELFEWGRTTFPKASLSIQTNGTLVNVSHIDLFKKFNIRVGLSMDGPDELNDLRWAGRLEKTRQMTARSAWALRELCKRGLKPNIAITVTRVNCGPDVLPRLIDWLKTVHEDGVTAVRLHLLEIDHPSITKAALTTEETWKALWTIKQLEKTGLRFDLFNDVRKLLAGKDKNEDYIGCVWEGSCDPLTTVAVQAVNRDGSLGNCGRVEKDGGPWRKVEKAGYERQLGLYYLPQEHGGCKGCKYFLMCGGHCPGTGLDGDTRLRTSHCAVLKKVFGYLEKQNPQSISLRADLPQLEQIVIDGWLAGKNIKIHQALQIQEAQAHAQQTSATAGDSAPVPAPLPMAE